MSEFWPYLLLLLVGFLPNEIWRWLGVIASRGLDEDSEIVVWVRARATAILAGVIARLITVIVASADVAVATSVCRRKGGFLRENGILLRRRMLGVQHPLLRRNGTALKGFTAKQSCGEIGEIFYLSDGLVRVRLRRDANGSRGEMIRISWRRPERSRWLRRRRVPES